MARIKFVQGKHGEIALTIDTIMEIIDEVLDDTEDEVREDFQFFGTLVDARGINNIAAVNKIKGVLELGGELSLRIQDLEVTIADKITQREAANV